MTKIPFIKMHGLGNDFVIIEDSLLSSVKNMKDFVIKVSDRRRGIGCDQFITYAKQDSAAKSISMKIFNQDGSKAKACGNASRCVSRLIFDKYAVQDIFIKVDDKVISTYYKEASSITVNMGEANFAADWMPKSEGLWELAEKYRIEPKELVCVDVGNPHLVIFSKLSDKDKKIIGKNLQGHPLFASGINVNFAKIENASDSQSNTTIIDLKVWERGAGFTMACGSGASATYAAANKLGFAGDVGIVQFEGGNLTMNKNGNEILMTGPAAYIFTGEYYYNE